MTKKWTKKEIAKLKSLVNLHGKKLGMQTFAIETNRSFDSVRVKYARLLSQKTDKDEEVEKNPIKRWFRKLINQFAIFF